jgi:integrase
VLLAAWCSLRQGELVELRRRDVNLAAGTVHVERAVVRVKGTQQVGPPKSRAGVRTVNIPPHLMPLVTDHLARFAQHGPDGLLFPSTSGKQPQSSSIYKWFTKAREDIGRPDIRLHDLRHSGATMSAQSGATMADLMSRLGHSSPRAAMLYQHAAEDRDKMLAARLSAMAEVG